MIKIHREGRIIVAITVLILLALVIVSMLTMPYHVNYLTSLLSLVVLVMV